MEVFTQKEKEILKGFKNQGMGYKEAMANLASIKLGYQEVPMQSEAAQKDNLFDKAESGFSFGETFDDIKGIGSDISNTIREGGEDFAQAGSLTDRGEQSAGSGLLQRTGALMGTIGGVGVDILKGLGKASISQKNEEGFAQTVQDISQSDLAQKIGGGVDFIKENIPLSDEAKRNVDAGFKILEGGTAATGLVGVRAGLIRGTEIGRDVVKTGGEIVREFEVPEFKFTTPENLPKISSPFKPDPRAVKDLTKPEISIGITPAFKTALAGNKDILKQYLDESIATFDNPNANVFTLARDRVDKAMDSVDKALKETGGDIGEIRNTFNTIKPNLSLTKSELDSFTSKVKERLGVVIQKTDEGIELISDAASNRIVRLSASDREALRNAYEDLSSIQTGTKQTVLDARVNLDSRIKWDTLNNDPLGTQVENILKGTRGGLKDILNDGLTPEQVAKSDRYGELLDVVSGYRQASSKGNNIEYFLMRVYGTRGTQALEVMDQIQEISGINLLADATAIRLAEKVASPDKVSRLRQAIEGAGLNAIEKAPGGGLLKGASETLDNIRTYIGTKKGVSPEIEKAYEVYDILMDMDI